MGRKLGALHPFWGEEVCSHLTEVAWAEAYLRTKWHLNPSNHLATMNMGRKVWGGGAGSELWCTWRADRTDRTTVP